MKKYLAFLMALLLTTVMLTGCGGSSVLEADYVENGFIESPAVKDEAVMEEAVDSVNGSLADSSASPEYGTEQKLIREVRIDAETEELDPLLEALGTQVAELGGYVENQEVYNGSRYDSYRSRSASLTIRIPAEKLDGFVSQVQGLSNVVNYNESAQDVTLQYVSTESRVEALETEEARLLELLEQAETMADLLEVEARLADVRAELEVMASQLRVLANRVNYATVYLNVDQVRVYTEVEEQTVWQRIGSGFSRNLRNLGEGLVDFFVWLVTYSPQLIFFAAVITLAVLAFRRRRRRRKHIRNDAAE